MRPEASNGISGARGRALRQGKWLSRGLLLEMHQGWRAGYHWNVGITGDRDGHDTCTAHSHRRG